MAAEESDEQLLREFVGGRKAALGELARRYERSLLGLAAALLGGRHDLACDAVQETWLRVIRFGGQFQGRSSVRTWLYRIGINQCRTLLATRAVAGEESLAGRPAGGPGPDQAARAADDNHAVRRAVEGLDDDRRLVILLCYHAGMTHEQAAEILEIPVGTLKSRLHAALSALRAALGAEVRA